MLICVATTTNELIVQQTYHLTILGLSIEPNPAAVHSRQRLIKQQNTKGPRNFHNKHLNYEGRDQETSGAYRLGQRWSSPVVASGRGGARPVPAPAAAVELVHPLATPPPPAAVAATTAAATAPPDTTRFAVRLLNSAAATLHGLGARNRGALASVTDSAPWPARVRRGDRAGRRADTGRDAGALG